MYVPILGIYQIADPNSNVNTRYHSDYFEIRALRDREDISLPMPNISNIVYECNDRISFKISLDPSPVLCTTVGIS